jgi:hypothetical protein
MAVTGRAFSTDYSVFKEYDSTVLRERVGDYLPISERLVSCLWYTQTYVKDLRTADGRSVKVLSPGVWNLEAGPDFVQAALEFEGGEVARGDIEVHTRSSDWEGHLHHQKPAFDSVIAQVCMWRDTDAVFLATSSGKRIPQIELSAHLTRPLRRIMGQIETEDFPYNTKAGLGRCAELLATLSKGQVRTLLNIAGEWRILEKSARYAEWLKEASFDVVLYKGLMEALGYPNNKEAFAVLAERIPFEVLREEASSRFKKVSHYYVQSVLMHLSGLFPAEPPAAWDEETIGFHRFMRSIWGDFSGRTSYFPMDARKWRLRVRPLNAPLRRMAAASLWIHRYGDQPCFLKLVHVFRDLSETDTRFAPEYDRFRREVHVKDRSCGIGNIRKRYMHALGQLYGLFRCEEDKYWSYRYDLGGKKVSRPVSLLGENRIREIVVNVAIPILLLRFRENEKEYESTLYLLYNFLPKLQENRITRLMRHRLFGKDRKDPPIESAVAQQGLHQLFKDYCSKDKGGCLECSFQANLRKWLEHASRGKSSGVLR